LPPPTREAPTLITLLQLAGAKFAVSALLLPAETTTVVPLATAVSIAACMTSSHGDSPPRLMLITSAGVGLVGTPGTSPPEAHTIASAMSDM